MHHHRRFIYTSYQVFSDIHGTRTYSLMQQLVPPVLLQVLVVLVSRGSTTGNERSSKHANYHHHHRMHETLQCIAFSSSWPSRNNYTTRRCRIICLILGSSSDWVLACLKGCDDAVIPLVSSRRGANMGRYPSKTKRRG